MSNPEIPSLGTRLRDLYAAERSWKAPEQSDDPLLQKDTVLGEIPAEFQGLDISHLRYDFPDNELLDKPGIVTPRLNDSEMVQLGRIVIPMLATGFTQQGAAAIFVLAYNLREPGSNYNSYIFDEEMQTNTGDQLYSNFSDDMLNTQGKKEAVTPLKNAAKEAAIYAYIAASLLRLFTKSTKCTPNNDPSNVMSGSDSDCLCANSKFCENPCVEMYLKAWNSIVDGFQRFYRENIEMTLPVPTKGAVESLARWMEIDTRAKNTLFRILYVGNASQRFIGLKRFLYDTHLANRDMDLAKMCFQLCTILNCSPEELLLYINTERFERQVKCLNHLLSLISSTKPEHARKMWQYGRLFDETFMADIKTTERPELVYMFAEALKSVLPEEYCGTIQIGELDVSEENKRVYGAAAQWLLKDMCTSEE